MNKIKASIVVPLLFQRDEWLRQCIMSALLQTVLCEVIVVVSPRTTPSNLRLLDELKQRYRNLEVLAEPPNRGFAGALNLGIKRAWAERVGFLLSDDWLAETAVEECLQFSTDIVSTGITVYAADGKTKIIERLLIMSEYNAIPTLEGKATYLKHFFMFRKEKLLEVGGVDESIGLTGPDDYDLIWTLLEHGAIVSVVEKSLYNYRDHLEERLTLRNKADQARDLEKILDKHGVDDHEKKVVMEKHSIWYGEPYHVVSKRLKGRP